ncbi:AraC family transcriptional regulator [Paenibacillus gansuensis]|uniref:AraC family transcriptional regulator n=1 Tax=Paenibacillus gansuensis TaxID=306542 RepID=A0ABW5PB43_9BACL
MTEPWIRFLLPVPEQTLPFYIDSIGYNNHEQFMSRPEGYPCYHWLHTASGSGIIHLESHSVTLPENHGILLLPGVAHEYEAVGERWSTYYLTFNGQLVNETAASLGIRFSSVYHWHIGSAFKQVLPSMISGVEAYRDITGLDHSIEVYRFLVELKKHGKVDNQPSFYSLKERLLPLLQFLESEYRDPDLDMNTMAAILDISARQLNSLFRKAFGYTPYQYLISLRLLKAKQFLIMDRRLTVQSVSAMTGFREASHFIATFRKAEGMTPEKFRLMHGRSPDNAAAARQ